MIPLTCLPRKPATLPDCISSQGLPSLEGIHLNFLKAVVSIISQEGLHFLICPVNVIPPLPFDFKELVQEMCCMTSLPWNRFN